MLEAAGLTALMGLFPPLRGMLFVTGLVLFLLLVYLGLVALMISRGELHAEPLAAQRIRSNPVMLIPEPAGDPALVADQDRLARLVGR
jgi:hypothetical protein